MDEYPQKLEKQDNGHKRYENLEKAFHDNHLFICVKIDTFLFIPKEIVRQQYDINA